MKIFRVLNLVIGLTLIMMGIVEAQTKVVVIPLDGGRVEIRGVWKGQWETGVSYETSDMVSFSGSSYIAINGHQAGSSNFPPNEQFWNVVAKSGDRGDKGDIGLTGPQGPVGPRGPAAELTGFWATAINDSVLLDACSFTCNNGGFSAFAAANPSGYVCRASGGKLGRSILKRSGNGQGVWDCGNDGRLAQCWCIVI